MIKGERWRYATLTQDVLLEKIKNKICRSHRKFQQILQTKTKTNRATRSSLSHGSHEANMEKKLLFRPQTSTAVKD